MTGGVDPSEEQVPLRLKVVGPRAADLVPYFLFYFEAVKLLVLAALDVEGIRTETEVGDHDSGFSAVDGEQEYLKERQLL